MTKTAYFILYSTLLIFVGFQNCSPAEFMVDPNNKVNNLPPHEDPGGDENDPNDPGISGGHFDFDTSHMVYLASKGTTDHHVHEYDDKYKTTQVDFFNMIDNAFTELSSVISANQNFVITVANAELSPGAMLEINGAIISAVDYQKKVDAFLAGQALSQYSLGSLSSFKVKFNRDVLSQNGLVPTQTGCVRGNDLTANGKYRNGALTIQLHDASKVKLDSKTRVASADGGLLWEATVFWHKDGAPCL
jgi:hypothetical protein